MAKDTSKNHSNVIDFASIADNSSTVPEQLTKEVIADSDNEVSKLEQFINNSEDGGFIIHPELFTVIIPIDNSVGPFTVEKQLLFEAIVNNILQQNTFDKFAIAVVFTYQTTLDPKWKEYLKLLTSSLTLRLEKNDSLKEVFSFIEYETDKADFDYALSFLKDQSRQQGKYVTFRTISPALWYPRHLYLHFSEFEKKKSKFAWSISKMEICNRNKIDNVKEEILGFRLEFPKNKDELLLDEMCFIFPYIMAQDFNKLVEKRDNLLIIHPYHILNDAHLYKMSGFIPDEISVKIYIDYHKNKMVVNKEKNTLKFE